MLDSKRSNAINIGLTALPQPRIIRTAILKMDNAVLNHEAIEVNHFAVHLQTLMIVLECTRGEHWRTY